MLNKFLKYYSKIGLTKQTKILLALSGGLDSVALLHLFKAAGLYFEVAHCNFNLREEESDADEQFVRDLCKNLNIKLHTKHFNTNKFAIQNGVSIQMAARDLRYSWFEEIRKSNQLHYIATAHHQDDQVETVLLNLSRGTGLKGMHGILAKQGTLIRPLLFCDRQALAVWMQTNKYMYREDSSNASEKYSRNKIRHQVLPILKEINPSLTKTFQENTVRFNGSENNLSFFYEKERSTLLTENYGDFKINLIKLQKLPAPIDALFYYLSDFGFQDWTAIEQLLTAETGKVISSPTHQLLKNRQDLVLQKINLLNTMEYLVHENLKTMVSPIDLSFDCIPTKGFNLIKNSSKALLDFDKLTFPLVLRKWKNGDIFQPLGMRGKKKLSDFFIDKKMSIFEKQNTWVVCSNEHIIWVVGQRIDERFKLVEHSQKVYLVQLNLK
jgi:tRNA(Ile)-lysidine synthase